MIAYGDDPGEQLLPHLRAWRRHSIHIGSLPPVRPRSGAGYYTGSRAGSYGNMPGSSTRPCSPATAGAGPIPCSLPG